MLEICIVFLTTDGDLILEIRMKLATKGNRYIQNKWEEYNNNGLMNDSFDKNKSKHDINQINFGYLEHLYLFLIKQIYDIVSYLDLFLSWESYQFIDISFLEN